MNPCIVALALALGCGTVRPADRPLAPTAEYDAWIGEDKLRHFAASFGATGMAFGGARFVAEPGQALPLAASAALALGLAKEIHDARSGHFSYRDLAWDAAGVALGVVLARRIE